MTDTRTNAEIVEAALWNWMNSAESGKEADAVVAALSAAGRLR